MFIRYLLICCLFPLQLFSQQIVDLFVVEGRVNDGNQFIPYFTFSRTENFDSSNAVLSFHVDDEVLFRVKNLTDFSCAFSIKDHDTIQRIDSGELKELFVVFSKEGTFLYEDPIQDHRALGLGGMVVVSDFNGSEFYGVFTEHAEDWIVPIADGGYYNKKVYHPNAFTINGKGFPDTMRDSLSTVRGKVGDTIHIHMTNSGQMYHFPHFHGYHVKVIEASFHKQYVGRMKDSFGIAPGESILVELVPDKPGRFPMHNHNLVTTTLGGNYPGGMMMHLFISE